MGAMRGLVKAAIDALPFGLKYEIFYQMGRALGVTAYQVQGKSGPIFGHLYDQSIIKPYLRDGEWSTDLTDLIASAVEGGGTFYDIGANIGTVILPVAMKNKSARCVGFEPDPGNFALLEANTAGRKNIAIMQVAVGANARRMRFTKSAYNSGDHRLSDHGEIEVDVIPLDNFPQPPSPLVVKIDTQGAEPAIFEGGANTLSRAHLIITEFWPWGMARMGFAPDNILKFAEHHFPRGLVLQHGQKIGDPVPISIVLDDLREIIKAGGEFDQADLILMK